VLALIEANLPIAILLLAVVLADKASAPTVTLLTPVVLLTKDC
jgi:hypothetical protein